MIFNRVHEERVVGEHVQSKSAPAEDSSSILDRFHLTPDGMMYLHEAERKLKPHVFIVCPPRTVGNGIRIAKEISLSFYFSFFFGVGGFFVTVRGSSASWLESSTAPSGPRLES